MSDHKVTIAGHEIALRVPKSVTMRQQVCMAAGQNVQLATAAALGACWAGKQKLRTTFEACGYNPLKYGQQVADEVYSVGATFEEVVEAGTVALQLCVENAGIITNDEVDAAESFLGPKVSSNTPSSKSKDSGTKSRGGSKRKTAKTK